MYELVARLTDAENLLFGCALGFWICFHLILKSLDKEKSLRSRSPILVLAILTVKSPSNLYLFLYSNNVPILKLPLLYMSLLIDKLILSLTLKKYPRPDRLYPKFCECP